MSNSLIPTGEIASVASKPIFDLRLPKRLGDVLPNCPGGENNGYDHNFCINSNFLKNQDDFDMRFDLNSDFSHISYHSIVSSQLSHFLLYLLGLFALLNISRVEENLNAILTNRVFNFIQVKNILCFLVPIGI